MRWWLSLAALLAVGCAPLFHPGPADVLRARELVDIGVAALRDGRLEDARAAFALGVELAADPAAVDGLGCVALLEGRLEEAGRYFSMARCLDESYAPAAGHQALLSEILGDKKAAWKLYLDALTGDPLLFRERNNFAVFLFDNTDKALQDVRGELLKAKTVAEHPLIEENLKTLDRLEKTNEQR